MAALTPMELASRLSDIRDQIDHLEADWDLSRPAVKLDEDWGPVIRGYVRELHKSAEGLRSHAIRALAASSPAQDEPGSR